MTSSKFLPSVIIMVGVISIAMGIAFFVQGFVKKDYMVSAMRLEQIKAGNIHIPNLPPDQLIDSEKTAQLAGDTIRSHRRKIAPSYVDLLGGKHFDPTNPKDLIYAQALNMENYLYLAVLAFGLIDVVYASGGFMILTGIALGSTGIILLKQSK